VSKRSKPSVRLTLHAFSHSSALLECFLSSRKDTTAMHLSGYCSDLRLRHYTTSEQSGSDIHHSRDCAHWAWNERQHTGHTLNKVGKETFAFDNGSSAWFSRRSLLRSRKLSPFGSHFTHACLRRFAWHLCHVSFDEVLISGHVLLSWF